MSERSTVSPHQTYLPDLGLPLGYEGSGTPVPHSPWAESLPTSAQDLGRMRAGKTHQAGEIHL